MLVGYRVFTLNFFLISMVNLCKICFFNHSYLIDGRKITKFGSYQLCLTILNR